MRTRRISRSALLVASLAFLTPGVVHAHGALKKSTPAAGTRLDTLPRELRLTFTQPLALRLSRVELIGPLGLVVPLDRLQSPTDSSQVLIAGISGRLTEGTYTVRWQIAGDDGHPVRGRYTFTVLPSALGRGAPGDAMPDESAAAPRASVGQAPAAIAPPRSDEVTPQMAFDAESPGYAAIRWFTFVGILLVVGAVAFHTLVLGALRRVSGPLSPMLSLASARAARIGYWAALTLGGAAVLRLAAQTYAFFGAEGAFSLASIGTLLGTTWGVGWIMQLAAVLALVVALRPRTSGAPMWRTATTAAVALAFTPALSGHAVAAPSFTWLAVLSDGLHVLGAAGWLGSLISVLVAGIPATAALPEGERGPAVAALITAFSPTALTFAGIAAVTGAYATWLHVGSVSAIWQSPYGRTLVLKLGTLSVVGGTGAYNWRRVKPRLGDATGTLRLQRSTLLEVGVALIVLLVTAVLVATPPATEGHDRAMRRVTRAPEVANHIGASRVAR